MKLSELEIGDTFRADHMPCDRIYIKIAPGTRSISVEGMVVAEIYCKDGSGVGGFWDDQADFECTPVKIGVV